MVEQLPLDEFGADNRKSDENVKLANKPKPNIAHKYLSSSKYPALQLVGIIFLSC
jgi:hypothetical protein